MFLDSLRHAIIANGNLRIVTSPRDRPARQMLPEQSIRLPFEPIHAISLTNPKQQMVYITGMGILEANHSR